MLPLGRITTRSNGFYLSDDYREYRQMLFNLFKMLNKAKQFARGYILTMTTITGNGLYFISLSHTQMSIIG